ncbi:AraC family transcriptional regulator with amidase-like domain [Stackebrandtia endophytica]|uniref:AraC family transcriptional regulator with amidase-like domain n=1 Tax=Stackebrandtia endophytica TaxID=1496996 RepID=A0A543AUP3_9ACTN|nr:helix-turn-helix domain-containing protein [Stackebrandtia endophytica]TQL76306.1 AraC family transcriptional regulator with amidase-like domain [Stackebrandtia endophytica]
MRKDLAMDDEYVSNPHRVAVLAQPGVIPFELGIPARIFGIARDEARRHLYRVTTCAVTPGPVATSADFDIVVNHGLEVLAQSDTVVVPASYEQGPAMTGGALPEVLKDALCGLPTTTRVASICIGSFVLAAAGLLNGRRATTHWTYTDAFSRHYPRITVDPDVLFVEDGNLLTSAGVAAGIDLCLHMVRSDHGSEVANRVARSSLVPPWRDGGQAQYIERPVPEPTQTSTAPAREWALRRLGEPVTLAQMAGVARMSVRTFSRRFVDEVGLTPGQWLIGQRIDHARRLLESTDRTTDQIARDAGFGTAASMRRHLHARLGVSPMAYRRTFGRD